LRELTRDRAPVKPEWRHEMTVIRPFAAWVLARAGQAEPANQTALFEARAGLPVFAKAMLALAIDASKRPEGRSQIETLLTEMRTQVKMEGQGATVVEKDGGSWRFTMSSDIRSTALLAMLLTRTHPEDPLLGQLHQGLLDSQRGGRWYNTQENAFAILALSERISADLAHDGSWQAAVHLGDEVILETTMDGRKLGSGRVVVPMDRLAAANGKALAVVRKGAPGNLYYTLHLRHVPVTPPSVAADHGFVVEREWRRKMDPPDAPAPTAFRLGDVIEVAITVQTSRDAAYVAIEDPLPAGFEPVLLMPDKVAEPMSDYEPEGDGGFNSNFNHADQRDDRVYLFADRLPAGRHVHRYLVRATSSGRFTAPAAMAHEMYAPWIEGHSAPTVVEVKSGSDS
jgi:uncharacterized protein YfaS (alpha-2-macroglobulin family)